MHVLLWAALWIAGCAAPQERIVPSITRSATIVPTMQASPTPPLPSHTPVPTIGVVDTVPSPTYTRFTALERRKLYRQIWRTVNQQYVYQDFNGADWASACDDFSHPISAIEKYPYTHRQYLERLANAKFGLCLAGYGYKCHREIECMAMGCVPVVAPEVDMTNYADAPVEGLHYFRAKTPEEAKAAAAITAERWTVMSAACRDWWQRNASVDGMWELTQRLSSSSS